MPYNTLEQIKEKKAILLLFFASGISGLIYEVVWFRILSRIVGITTYATAIVLAAFMLGLAFGSFIIGNFIDRRQSSLKNYALLQLLIALAALITTVLLKISLPFYKYIYEISSYNLDLIIIIRGVLSFILLLIPTALMGGTLPVLTSYIVRKERSFGKNFSLLYGINAFGAVFGVILSGFITIGIIGEWNTILIGVLINFTVGSIALRLYMKGLKKALKTDIEEVESITTQKETLISSYPDNIRRIVLISILISGFTALAYEVIWSRWLILFLRTSIYAFSAMLAVFLTGIAAGSLCTNKFIDKLKAPLIIFGVLELAIAVLSIFNLYLFYFLDRSLFRSLTDLGSLLGRVYPPIILIFPLTFLFGAIFPIASLCYAKSIKTTGFSVGTFYGFNAIGNVAGCLFTGFLFIKFLGSTKTIILLSLVNATLGLILIYHETNKSMAFKSRYLLIAPLIILLVLTLKGEDPFMDVIERRIASGARDYKIFYNQECVEGTVTSFIRDGDKQLWINGCGQAILSTKTKLMAHLPIMLAREPKNILIICFGMGTTMRSAAIYDDLNITALDLVPEVYECFKYYHHDAEEIKNRKNINFVAEDGRNFLLFSQDKYDVITVDPSPPIFHTGTVNLYTKEFLSLCKKHLAPNGVMCLWFPFNRSLNINDMDYDTVYVLSTFYSVFPNITVWKAPQGWGIYMIGTLTANKVSKTKIEKAFKNQKLLKDLSEFDNSCITSSQLLSLLIMDSQNIERYTNERCIISDNYPYTEFPLWRWLFRYLIRKIFPDPNN